MLYKLIFHDELDFDIANAFQWYENQSVGLGDRFVENYWAAVDILRKSPLGFQIYRAPYRKVSINRFPYGVFYYVENEQVMITGVFHSARDPNNIFNKLQQRK